MFALPHLNMSRVGRTQESYANPRHSQLFAKLSRILPTPQVLDEAMLTWKKILLL